MEQTINHEQSVSSPGYEAPQGDLECAIARLWMEAFNIDRICRHDNFFELGGNSLLAMNLTEAFETSLELSIPVVAVFQNPTIADLASYIGGASE
jgi:acyl carrier protein